MTNVLITGASGYLGGDLLHLLRTSPALPSLGTIHTLVRTDEQAQQVKDLYGASPVTLDLSDETIVTKELVERKISIVFFLIDAFRADAQLSLIRALSAVSEQTGLTTHFLHTSGAKLFSGFASHPIQGVFSDADADLFTMQKTVKPHIPILQIALDTNSSIIELGGSLGVRVYIFIPCLVYGESRGFGNKISIQTKAVIQAAKAARSLSKPDRLNGTWPVCHVSDNSSLYARLLSAMLANEDIPNGRTGYYLASSGLVSWADVYAGIARGLANRDVIDSAEVKECNDEWLEQAAKTLSCPKPMVALQMGGSCVLIADHGPTIGWVPKHDAQHVLTALDREVELVLSHI